MKFKTVYEGDKLLLINYRGEAHVVTGPTRIFIFRQRYEKLMRYHATDTEYLVVRFFNGKIENLPGPIELYKNPFDHQSVEVKDAMKVDANHIIVVYRKGSVAGMERRLVQGPSIFVPNADEWVHQFKWHGVDINNKTRYIPGNNNFVQLPVVPDQFYYNVREVRTKDDTLLTVKLMIFYTIKDVILMLEATQDPIGDIINAVCADVIAFAGKLTYQQFLGSTELLGKLETYSQLQQRTKAIGYEVSKVVYRGYHASDRMQEMMDDQIRIRTELRLTAEFQEQQQKVVDYKLEQEQKRSKMKQDLDLNRIRHKHELSKLRQTHELELQNLSTQAVLNVKNMRQQQNKEFVSMETARLEKFFDGLRGIGLDLTKYVKQIAAPISKEYRVGEA